MYTIKIRMHISKFTFLSRGNDETSKQMAETTYFSLSHSLPICCYCGHYDLFLVWIWNILIFLWYTLLKCFLFSLSSIAFVLSLMQHGLRLSAVFHSEDEKVSVLFSKRYSNLLWSRSRQPIYKFQCFTVISYLFIH